jgi:hypothetical protein
MYFVDHAPPHFHAVYGEHELVIGLDPLAIMVGHAPRRVRGMVLEWAQQHAAELAADWELCQRSLPPRPIAPLE